MRLHRPSALVLVVLLGCNATAGQSGAPIGAPPSRDEIQAAVAKLRADPILGGEKRIKELRWTDRQSAEPPQNSPAWLVGLFEFFGQTASVLLWVAAVIGAAITSIWIIRTLKARLPAGEEQAPAAVLHVRQLDIRPASLPEDVGGAALALLEAGRTRDALSLLYRGALSRVVHRYGVVIGESYTEGEALKAVDVRLDFPRVAYFSDLVGVWQRVVYAGEGAANEHIASLCSGFSPALDGLDR